MSKTKLALSLVIGFVFCCGATSPDQLKTMSISCGSEFVAPHELRDVKVVHLEVDGFPVPVEGSAISEVTLAGQLKNQLAKVGLVASFDYVSDAPTLHIRVLPVRGEGQYFFVITAELQEACHVRRSGGIDMPFCTTWSIYPRLGFFDSDNVAALEAQVADVGKQFIDAWSYDNLPIKK